jgi:hypothetical protein
MTIAAALLRRLPTAARTRALRRPQACLLTAPRAPFRLAPAAAAFSTARRAMAEDPHENETFEEFTARYENEFEAVNDVFELQVSPFFAPSRISRLGADAAGAAQPEQRLCVRPGALGVGRRGRAAGLPPRQRLPDRRAHPRRYVVAGRWRSR